MAAGNAIGTGAILLTANADGIAPGFATATAATKAWGTTIGGMLSGVFSGKGILGGVQNLGTGITTGISSAASAVKGALTGIGGGIGMALGGPIGGAIGSAVGSAVGGLGEAVAGALAAPFDKVNEFGKIVKQSAALGVGASQFQGLTKVLGRAGIEGDAVSQTFAAMGKNIADASQGHGRAFPALQALGVDAKALMALPIDEQFKGIADAISKLPPGAQQASAALHIFGGAGAALLPELQKGGKGIQEFIEQQKSMGAVLSDSQLKAASDAAKAWKGAKNAISTAWEGLVNRATIIAAPIIEFAGKAITKAFALLTPVFDWVGRAVGQVADIAGAVFEQLTVWFDQGINEIKAWGTAIEGIGVKWMSIQEVIVRVFRAIGTAGAYAFDAIKVGLGVVAIGIGKLMQGFGHVTDAFKNIAQLGKLLPDNAKPTWMNGFIAGVEKFDGKVKETGKDISAWGWDAASSFGQSAVNFNRWLDNALKPKPKAPTPVAPGIAAGGLMGTADPTKFAGAVEAGSKEAYSIALKATAGWNGGENGWKDDIKKQTGFLGRISGMVDAMKSQSDKWDEAWNVI